MSLPGPKVTARRLSRELALQTLYQVELTQHAWEDVVREFPMWQVAKASIQTFARELVEGVLKSQHELDDALAKLSENWSLDRMAPVDRNILRLGAYELTHCPDTPAKVAINEAIELAKKFGTAQSGRFVNGVLDALSKNSPGKKSEESGKSEKTDDGGRGTP